MNLFLLLLKILLKWNLFLIKRVLKFIFRVLKIFWFALPPKVRSFIEIFTVLASLFCIISWSIDIFYFLTFYWYQYAHSYWLIYTYPYFQPFIDFVYQIWVDFFVVEYDKTISPIIKGFYQNEFCLNYIFPYWEKIVYPILMQIVLLLWKIGMTIKISLECIFMVFFDAVLEVVTILPKLLDKQISLDLESIWNFVLEQWNLLCKGIRWIIDQIFK